MLEELKNEWKARDGELNPQDIWDCFGGIIHKIRQARQELDLRRSSHFAYSEQMAYTNERGTSKFWVAVSIIMTEDETLTHQYMDEFDAWLKTKNLMKR